MLEKIKNEIEINEEKSIKSTNLYLRNVSINQESYETKMLSEENIDGILKFQIIYEGEERVLYYDVSNTISLEEYIKTNKLKKKDICDILDSVDKVLSSIENYLISENSISLDLKLIRVAKESSKNIYKFAAIPNLKSDFSRELSKFLLKILRFIDISDGSLVSLAYGLFVRSSKDNYTINDLMELIDIAREKTIKKEDFDLEAIAKYDEELANEISEEIIENNREREFYAAEFIEEPGYVIKNEKPSYIENNKEPVIDIDTTTKNIINDILFDSFDEPKDKKILKFKKPFDFFTKKHAMKAHISLDLIRYIMSPIAMIAIPLLYYLLLGTDKFLQALPLVYLSDGIIAVMVIFRIIKNKKA